MATVGLTLSAHFRPAYFALLDCAREIALTHGEEAAMEWASRTIGTDFDLFVRLAADRERPRLRLIEGGR